MLLTGPNKELDMKSFHEDCEFDMHGSDNVIREFYPDKDMYCIVMVKSGILKMNHCILSLDGMSKETHKKVPCIAALSHTNIEIFHSNFKGDTLADSYTTGILAIKCDIAIHECSFAHFNSGAIMIH